jgi:hypothetical protein
MQKATILKGEKGTAVTLATIENRKSSIDVANAFTPPNYMINTTNEMIGCQYINHTIPTLTSQSRRSKLGIHPT